MQFNFDESSPLYQQLADQLEEMIFSGGFDEGSQVPSTTQLSQQLHINPATVLKGMNILVDKDLLEKRSKKLWSNVKRAFITTTLKVY